MCVHVCVCVPLFILFACFHTERLLGMCQGGAFLLPVSVLLKNCNSCETRLILTDCTGDWVCVFLIFTMCADSSGKLGKQLVFFADEW